MERKESSQIIIRDMEVRHLQVFDFRSNRKEWSQLAGLNPEEICFVCSRGSTLFKQLSQSTNRTW